MASRIPVCTESWVLPCPSLPCRGERQGSGGSGGTESSMPSPTCSYLLERQPASRARERSSLFQKAWHLPHPGSAYGSCQPLGNSLQLCPDQTSEAPGGTVSGGGAALPCLLSRRHLAGVGGPSRDPEASQQAGAGQPPARSLLSQEDGPSQEAPVGRSSSAEETADVSSHLSLPGIQATH